MKTFSKWGRGKFKPMGTLKKDKETTSDQEKWRGVPVGGGTNICPNSIDIPRLQQDIVVALTINLLHIGLSR